MESKIEKKYIWHRIKRGQTLSRIAKRNGIESWKELYDFNKDLLKNPNLLIYIDEKEYDDGWCINNKQGILRIPIADHLNSQAQPEEKGKFSKDEEKFLYDNMVDLDECFELDRKDKELYRTTMEKLKLEEEVKDTSEEIDNTKLVMPPSAYEQAEKDGFDMRNKVKSELLPEDTPEEWEKNRKEFSEYWANHLHEEAQEWLDDKDKLGRPEYTMEECIKVVRYYIRQDTKAQELIYYIKQLLDEREREAKIEVLTEIFQTCYQEDSKTRELVEEKLSKLKDKK